MALEPITRQEKIIAGEDLTPITRMEKFLKQYGGGGGGGASSTDVFIIHGTSDETYTSVQFDKTTEQIYEAYQSGKYCLVSLDGMFVQVVYVKADDMGADMMCCGFAFGAHQGRAVDFEFVTNDGVTWSTHIASPVLYNVCFSGLQIYSSGRVYTISVDADGNVTATAVT